MKSSITIALEKVLKVYASCSTIKQYLTANKFRQLFRKMYMYGKGYSVSTELYREIEDKIYSAEKACLNSLKK